MTGSYSLVVDLFGSLVKLRGVDYVVGDWFGFKGHLLTLQYGGVRLCSIASIGCTFYIDYDIVSFRRFFGRDVVESVEYDFSSPDVVGYMDSFLSVVDDFVRRIDSYNILKNVCFLLDVGVGDKNDLYYHNEPFCWFGFKSDCCLFYYGSVVFRVGFGSSFRWLVEVLIRSLCKVLDDEKSEGKC